MAWWDHEELKSPQDRSNRYKLRFPEEYTQEQVKKALDAEIKALRTSKRKADQYARLNPRTK